MKSTQKLGKKHLDHKKSTLVEKSTVSQVNGDWSTLMYAR